MFVFHVGTMNENDEFVRKLKERYEKGEISRENYEDILKRYREEKKNSEEIEMKDKNIITKKEGGK